MLTILTDSREQEALKFNACEGVSFKVSCLSVGDYSCSYNVAGKEVMSDTVFERKSVADAWGSFSGENYNRERAKMLRYKDCGFLKYILAIEAGLFDVRKGHSYWKGGEEHVAKKDGLSMIRQFCTCSHKYGITVMFFNGREEMAFFIQEYFMAFERG